MAAIITLMGCASGAAFAQLFRSCGPTTRASGAAFAQSFRALGSIAPLRVLCALRTAARAFFECSLRSRGTTAQAKFTLLGRTLCAFGPTVYLLNPTPAATRCVPTERPFVAPHYAVTRSGPLARPHVTHHNPARHGVTPMAPQDFPLCAAFQEE